jgi:uncharacterized delta-60 repeat protein
MLPALVAALALFSPGAASAHPGQLDPTFASGAVGTADMGALADAPQVVVRRPDGELVIAGIATRSSGNDVAVLDLNSDGTPNTGWGSAGKATVALGGTTGAATVSVGVRPDGSLLVGAITNNASPIMVATISPTGTASAPTFLARPAAMTSTTDIRVDGANGFVYVVGNSGSGNNHVALTRYTATANDGTFGTAGVADRTFGVGTAGFASFPRLAVQSDGKPLVAVTGVESNNTTSTVSLLRFTTGGTVDGGYGSGGEARIPASPTTQQGSVSRVTTSAAGAAVTMIGLFFAVERFTPDGQPVNAFSGDGYARVANNGFAFPLDVVMADDGTLTMTGNDIVLTTLSQSVARTVTFVTRVLPDGTPDTTWGMPGDVGPVSELPTTDPQSMGETGSLLTPEGLVVVGVFTMLSTDSNPNPPSLFGFARLRTAPDTPPVVSLAAAPAAQTVASPVTFTATASDPDVGGSVVRYEWDFDGDGTIDRITTGNTASFTYGTAGSYTAKVTAVDDEGVGTQAGTPVTITPTADQLARAAAPAGLKKVGVKVKVSKKPKHGTTRKITVSFTNLAGAAGPLRTFVALSRGKTPLVAQSRSLATKTKSLTMKVKVKHGQKLKLAITFVDRFGNVRTVTKTFKVK